MSTEFPTPKNGAKWLTIGECYGPAMSIQTEEDAAQYFEALVAYATTADPSLPRERHIEIQKANLGYFAGYYDSRTRERVERLFNCVHPVFGSSTSFVGGIRENPTPAEAVDLGRALANGNANLKKQPVGLPTSRRIKRTLIID